MKRKTTNQLLVLIAFVLLFFPSLLSAQGKGAQKRDLSESKATELYKQGRYKEACDYYAQACKINRNIKTSKITMALCFFFLIDAIGVFLFLYLEKQKAYHNLVKQNMQWANSMTTIDTLSKQTENTLDERGEAVLQKLIKSFSQEKVYLQSDITINELAKTLGTTRVVLSKIINTYFQKNFSSLLNEYRVKEAIKLLTDSKTKNYKLEAIAQMCGYNNRQVFHSAFKKETSLTPLDFKELSAKKDI